MTPIRGQLYDEREKRFNDIVSLRKPDRVPVAPLIVHYFSTRYQGISDREAGYNDCLRYESCKKAVLEFGWDLAAPNGITPSGLLEAMGALQIAWPGGTLPDNVPYQFIEKEYMLEEEYDEFLEDPNRFAVTKLFPDSPPTWVGSRVLFRPLSGSVVRNSWGARAMSSPGPQ